MDYTDGRTENQIDHVLVDNRNKSIVPNFRIIRGAEYGSAHHLVIQSQNNTENYITTKVNKI